MSAFRSWRWSALAIAVGLVTSTARAEMITPDSISNPPSAVSSANGTAVSTSNLVSTQYAGVGLNFGGAEAITKLNGVSVWAPVGGVVGSSAGAINYAWGVAGSFQVPGLSNQMTVSSLSVDIIGVSGTPLLELNGLNGQPLNIVPVLQNTPRADGGQVWTFTGAGIHSFSVAASGSTDGPWGVSAVSFTPATAPEPSSIVLAGLGVLGLAARFARRRDRTVA